MFNQKIKYFSKIIKKNDDATAIILNSRVGYLVECVYMGRIYMWYGNWVGSQLLL